MEAREHSGAGVTVIGAEAPSDYHMAPRAKNPNQLSGSLPAGGLVSAGTVGRKKRGRPRKYGPDGTVNMTFSPLPLSSSAPPAGIDFSTPGKRGGRGRGVGLEQKQPRKVERENLGELVASPAGANFTPHVVLVNAGEDVTMKIISFSQQGPRAICILSANGIIKNVTLRQPDSSGGTLTYEGRFEILSLTGSFTPTESGGTRSRAGGLSVSLASPDGRVLGGGVAGLLVAASPVQVVVGSFIPSSPSDQKIKKLRNESVQRATGHTSSAENEDGIGGPGNNGHNSFKPNLAPPSYRSDNWGLMHPMQDSRKPGTDINISLPVG